MTRTATVNIQATDWFDASTDDFDLAETAADRDGGLFTPMGVGGWLIGDGLDAPPAVSGGRGGSLGGTGGDGANFIPSTDAIWGENGAILGEDSVHLIGTSDALATSDFYLI